MARTKETALEECNICNKGYKSKKLFPNRCQQFYNQMLSCKIQRGIEGQRLVEKRFSSKSQSKSEEFYNKSCNERKTTSLGIEYLESLANALQTIHFSSGKTL